MTAPPETSQRTRAALEQIAAGPLARRLVASLRRRHPRRAREKIDEAFQEAYARALRSCPVEDEPAVYPWLWRTMDHVLVDRVRLLTREPPTPETDSGWRRSVDVAASPELDVERDEQGHALASLFSDVARELQPRQRAVLGLYVINRNRIVRRD